MYESIIHKSQGATWEQLLAGFRKTGKYQLMLDTLVADTLAHHSMGFDPGDGKDHWVTVVARPMGAKKIYGHSLTSAVIDEEACGGAYYATPDLNRMLARAVGNRDRGFIPKYDSEFLSEVGVADNTQKVLAQYGFDNSIDSGCKAYPRNDPLVDAVREFDSVAGRLAIKEDEIAKLEADLKIARNKIKDQEARFEQEKMQLRMELNKVKQATGDSTSYCPHCKAATTTAQFGVISGCRVCFNAVVDLTVLKRSELYQAKVDAETRYNHNLEVLREREEKIKWLENRIEEVKEEAAAKGVYLSQQILTPPKARPERDIA